MGITQETDFGYFVGINGKEQLYDIRNGRFIRLAHAMGKTLIPEKQGNL